MRGFIYIGILGFLISCGGEVNQYRSADMEENVAERAVSLETGNLLLVEKKIQEQLELKSLRTSYPEFDVTEQEHLVFGDRISPNMALDQIKTFGHKTMGDTTILEVKMIFKDEQKTVVDSIQAKIITEEITVAGEALTSKKVSLQSMQNNH
ncbi:hypothetical protein [Spongiimicrobium sp. 2-473A-2-J]|uniref:hypothetical protein n=1 Tax=Eudoraea algarum TaxID=3417568 RepID=UPI003D3658CF